MGGCGVSGSVLFGCGGGRGGGGGGGEEGGGEGEGGGGRGEEGGKEREGGWENVPLCRKFVSRWTYDIANDGYKQGTYHHVAGELCDSGSYKAEEQNH